MALLVTSVFGVTGCGSDDDVAVESRVKNAAPDANNMSYGLMESDCDLYDLSDHSEDRTLIDHLERLDILDWELIDPFARVERLDLKGLLDLLDRLDRRDQCAAELKSGNYAPEGDDVDGG